jgi:hypothetical protein
VDILVRKLSDARETQTVRCRVVFDGTISCEATRPDLCHLISGSSDSLTVIRQLEEWRVITPRV